MTGNNLALVILTHYHADHMSGFATELRRFCRVRRRRRLDHQSARSEQLRCFEIHGAAHDCRPAAEDATRLLATIPPQSKHTTKWRMPSACSENGGGGSNAKALKLLQSGFKNKPPVYYYQGGDTPTLPDELEGMITAEILAPSPKDSGRRIRGHRQQDRAIPRRARRQWRARHHENSAI